MAAIFFYMLNIVMFTSKLMVIKINFPRWPAVRHQGPVLVRESCWSHETRTSLMDTDEPSQA